MGRIFKTKWWSAVTALALLTILTTPAFAASPPDSLKIHSAKVFRHLLEDNDFLVVAHYEISYTTIPSEPASELFLVRLITSDGQEAGVTVPYAYFSKGYGQGVVSLYFPASKAPVWLGGHTLKLEGNPTQFSLVPQTTYQLTVADYSTETTRTGNQDQLRLYVLSLAEKLEEVWGIALVVVTASGKVLNVGDGQAYFSNAIPGLQRMVPALFPIRERAVVAQERVWIKSYASSLEKRYQNTIISEALQGMSDWLKVPVRLIGGIFILIGFIAVVILAQMKLQATSAGILLGVPILLAGSLWGWLPMTVLFIIAFLLVLYIGYLFFFKAG